MNQLRRIIQSFPNAYRPVRRAGLTLQRRLFGVRHPIDDLIAVARQVQPTAILDIGAHVGNFTRDFAKHLPGTTIHAFEPTPSSFSILQREMSGFHNVQLHQVAVSDEDGTTSLFLNAHEQSNSLLDNDVDNERFLKGLVRHVNAIDVPEVRLDSWAPIHAKNGMLAIKADIQGAEMKMISGARNLFASRVAALTAEVSLARMYKGESSFFEINCRMTTEFPFTFYQLYKNSSDYTGRVLWADAMWVRTDLLEGLRLIHV